MYVLSVFHPNEPGSTTALMLLIQAEALLSFGNRPVSGSISHLLITPLPCYGH